MQPRFPKQKAGTPGAGAFLAQLCGTVDRCLPALRTALLVAGIATAALRIGRAADFLFVTGLVLHLSIWFEGWWTGRQAR